MIEEDISNDYDISGTFNKFFVNIVPNLKIIPSKNVETTIYETGNSVQNAINKFKNCSSIKMISKINLNKRFCFCSVQHNKILKQIKNLDTEKAIEQNDIPTKLLKQNSYFFSNFFHKNVNQCIKNSKFLYDLKLADVTPCYIKKSKSSKHNYRPVSILPNVSKIYETFIYNQMQQYFDNI